MHFIILSFLCGGLWIGINWFAAEIGVAQAEEEERVRREGKGGVIDEAERDADADVDVDRSGEDTEIEETLRVPPSDQRVQIPAPVERWGERQETTPTNVTSIAAGTSTSGATWNTGAAARLAPAGAETTFRKRNNMADSTELSTDSEWEKVEGEQ